MKLAKGMLVLLVGAWAILGANSAIAYERYNGGCQNCHGAFTDDTSTKGSTFPGGDKHDMHRGNSNMNTDCDLCHTSGDNRNPFIGSSDGTADTPGFGCVGCHGRVEDQGNDGGGFANSAGYGAGLRQHHGTGNCATFCHSDSSSANYTPVGEQFKPPYYGSVDTNAAGACNSVASANTNENWTTGDTIGLDNDGDGVYDGLDSDCPAPSKTAGDFAFDGRADILWREMASGQNWLYLMSGKTIDDSLPVNVVSNLNWVIVGNGDYDGNGTADVLWRNTSTGQNWMYLMAGTRIFSSVQVNVVGNQNWEVVGNGDFDGDGKSDILWREMSTGQNWMYLMDGATIATSTAVNIVSNQDWQVAGIGDFNADTRDDILWWNSATGDTWMYLMNGSTVSAGSGRVVTVGNLDWRIVGTGDYDGNGNADIMWREMSSGQNWMYFMNGTTIDSSVPLNVVSNLNWKVVGSRDYDGDGNSDILWHEVTAGDTWMYRMDGTNILDSSRVSRHSNLNWEIINVD